MYNNIQFEMNYARYNGGAMKLNEVENFYAFDSITFINNSADSYGGSIYVKDSSIFKIENNMYF